MKLVSILIFNLWSQVVIERKINESNLVFVLEKVLRDKVKVVDSLQGYDAWENYRQLSHQEVARYHKSKDPRYSSDSIMSFLGAIIPWKDCLNPDLRIENNEDPLETFISYVVLKEDFSNLKLNNYEKNKNKVLMSMVVTSSEKSGYQYHMGIHRSLDYIVNKNENTKGLGLKDLSIYLHSFAAEALNRIYGEELRYVISNPVQSMLQKFKKFSRKIPMAKSRFLESADKRVGIAVKLRVRWKKIFLPLYYNPCIIGDNSNLFVTRNYDLIPKEEVCTRDRKRRRFK